MQQYSFNSGRARRQGPGVLAGLDWNSFSLRGSVVTGQDGLFWTFGLGYNTGSEAAPLSPPVGSASDEVIRAYVYGSVEPSASPEDENLDDRVQSAKDSFERKLDKAVRNIGAISEIELLYDLLKLKFDSLEGVPQVKASWKTIFWNAFFSNPHIDLTWMPFARSKMPQDLNVYESWHERGTTYAEMLRILLDREYVIDDYDALNNVLIPELEYFAITIAVSEDVLKIIEDILNKRLDEISPDSPKGLFAYIRAIWLLDVWLNERYNLLQEVDIETLSAISEKLSKLMEVYIRIPLGPLKQLLLIDNPKVTESLWQHVVREIVSGDITKQTKGLLAMVFLLTQPGGKDEFKDEDAKDLLYPIFDPVIQDYEFALNIPPLQPLVAGVPVNPLDADENAARESQSFQRIKAAMLALRILIENGLPLKTEKIEPLIRAYENLKPELQKELHDEVIFGQDGKRIYRLLKIKPKPNGVKPDGRKETMPLGRKYEHASLTPGRILSILPVLTAGMFLTGCNGSGAGAFGAIGIMLLLGAVISQRGSGKGDSAAEAEGEKVSGKTYKPAGAKGAEDFLDAVNRYGNERTIVAYDTDIGNLSRREHPAQSLLQTLESNRFKGMTVIKAKGSSNLMDALRREIGDRKDLNIIVICKNTNSDKLADLRNTGNRVFISSVNDSKINSIAYIPILELIALSLILSSGAGFDEVKELYSRITHEELTQEAYRMAKEGLLLVLPEIKRIDLEEIYDVQNKELLRSA